MKYRLIPRVSLSYVAATFAPLVANSIDPTPTVVTGQVDFIGLDTHSAIINQATQKAIVDYSYFNIPERGSVRFNQPNSDAAILNRITGADPSSLNGTLTANGQVFFVNPAGVTFGANSVIRADIFMAAAGQMSNEDFLNNIQNFSLTGNVENLGSIQTENEVGLFGQQVVNNGEIVSNNGYAIVASGDEIHVRQGGTGLSVDVTDASEGSKNGVGIKNLGTADGEEVMFSAGDAFATAIQQSGTVKARKSAKILSDGGVVEVSGEITARNEDGQGGRIEVGGTDKGGDSAPVASQAIIAKSAVLDASSDSGDGGHIVVYSSGHTQFDGLADATSSTGDGGFIEASGKTLDFDNMVESVLLGPGGHFLIDPEEITIDTNSENSLNASAIETQLDSGATVTVETNSSLDGNGNINVNANIQVPTNNRGDQGLLILDADGDIIVGGGVTVENLQEGFALGETVFDFKAGGDITLNGDVRHSGINGELGRGTIKMAAGGEILLNNTIIDANGGSVIIDAQKLTLSGLSSGILSGFTGENTSKVYITATDQVNFSGGNIQTFGGSDIFIDTGLLTNNTGSTAIARTDLAESFFGIRLPAPENNGLVNNASNHIYGGVQSGARARFNFSDFDAEVSGGITGNQYYYINQPTVNITAKDGSKTYGDAFNPLAGAGAVDVTTSDFVSVPLGDPFIADTTANALDLSGVTTTSAGEAGDADAGTHDIIAEGAASNNGYSFVYTEGNLTVNPRAITLTANEQEKTYGDTHVLVNDKTFFTVTDLDGDAVLPNGEVVTNVTINSATGVDASTTSDVATYADEIVISGPVAGTKGTGDGFLESNYDITYVAGDLTVNRRAAQIIASAQEKDYGDVHDLGDTAFTVVDRDGGALPNSETVNTVTLVSENGIDALTTANSVLYADNISVTPTSTNAPTISGSANFNQENYTFSYGTGDLTVNRRAAQIIASAQNKDYGDVHDLGDTAFTVVDRDGGALPNGETVNTVTLVSENGIDASTDANAVLYADNISVTPTSTNDPTITGSANFNQENYTFSYDTGDLTVNRRAAQIIASAQNKDYGDVHDLGDTAFTVVDRDGGALPNSETVNTVTLVSENGVDASTDADVGTYADNISVTPTSTNDPTITGSANFNQENYTFSYGTGDLTINRRAITLTANEQEKIYGDQLALDDTVFTTLDKDGDAVLPNGEVVTNVTINSATGVDASTTSDVATYADEIVISGPVAGTDGSGDGFLESNYDITYVAGDLTVNRRAAQIIASAQEKDYGDVHDLGDTAFTVVDRDGGALPNGETVNTVTLVSENGIDASTDANAVLYADNISVTPTSTNDPTITGSANFNQENYTFSYDTGDLTVNRRAAQIIASAQNKDYGDVHDLGDTAFTVVDRDGGALPNSETVNTVTLVSENGVDASTDADVGTYADNISVTPTSTNDPTITGSANFNQENYTFSYGTGDLTINRRAITLTANEQEKIYGDQLALDDTVFTTLDKDGDAVLPNGEVVTNVTINSATGVDASTTSDVATYADEIVISGPVAGTDGSGDGFLESNYDITYVAGDLTVNRRAAQIIASAQEKDYGDVHDLGDTAFTVVDRDGGALPNGETVNTVTLVSENGIDASTDANAVLYADNISVTPTSTNDPTITGSANFNQENYTFSYDTGDLTVNRRAAQIIASAQNKDYGDVHDLGDTAFTVVDRDGGALPNSETVNTVTLVSENGVDASTDADVGTYADNISVTPTSTSDPTIAGSANFNQENYTFSYGTGDLTINRRAITLTANEQEKIYGDQLALDDTVFTTLDKDGDAVLPNGEVVTNVTINSATGVDASTTSDVATYADEIVISGPVAGTDGTGDGFLESNYDITYVSGDLTVNRRAAQIIASAQNKDYGDVHDLGDTAFTVVDRDGGALPNGETVNTVTLVSENGIDASTDANAVLYADNISVTPTSTNDPTITGSANFNQENYTFSYGTGDLTVNRRAAQIIASAQEKDYGDVHDLGDAAFTVVDRDGGDLPNGETVNTVTLVSENGIDASTDANAVLYADNISVTPTSTNDSTITGSANFNQENYTFSYGTGDLTINRRAITLTANEQEKIYGDQLALDDTVFTTLDKDGDAVLPNGEVVTNVTINSATGVDASTTSDVATYADEIVISGPVAGTDGSGDGFLESNYDITYVAGDLTVNRRAAQIIASAQEKDYGDVHDLGDTAFTVVDRDGGALPNGETVNTVTLVSENGIDASTDANAVLYADNISVTPTSTNDPTITGSANFNQENYTFSYGTGDLTVNRRAAQIIASAQEKDYGDVHDLGDAAFTVVDRDGGALPNGETVNTVTLVSENGIDASTDANAVLYADNISVTPTSTNDPTITGSANFNQENYTFSYDTGDLTVNRRAAQIIASAQNKDYGDVHDLGDTAFTVVDRDGGALPNSETVNTVTLVSENGVDASTDADVGTYADNISVTPTSTNDPTITGSANFNQENYTFSYGTGDFTVNRRAITLTANEQEKIYGDQLALDDTVFTTLDKDGDAVLPNGEVVTNVTINSAIGVDASTTSDVATYTDEIVISGPVAGTDGSGDGFLESNYDITYVAGDLTLNRRAAQIIASAQNKDYGDVHDLGDMAFTVVDRDGGALPNGETVNTVTLVSENGIDASTDANAVLYADNISVTPTSTNDPTITGSANFNQENYNFSYGTGDFTVNRRAITLTANEQEKTYGDQLALDDTVFTTLDKDGDAVLPNGEVVTNVTINSATGVDASTTSDVATYADEIVISGPVAGTDGTGDGFLESNYDITYVAGDLTVNRRAAQIIASAQEKDYGDVHDLGDTAFTVVDRDGGALPNGETVNTVTLVSENGVDASTDADVGTYADNISVTPTSTNDPTITGSANFNQENYTFSYDTGDLTVNRRAAQIIASAQNKDYGDVHDLGDTAFTVVDRDGGALPNSETVNTVTLVSENGVDASTDADVGTYADNISVTPTSTNDPTIAGSANFNQENYTFSYGTGDFTVNRRAITLTANEQEKTYGDQLALDDTVFTTLDKDGDAVLPNGEVVTNVTINSATGVDASTTSDVATYADEIVISGPVAGTDGTGDGFLESNYDITYVAGDLTVNRRAAQIIASAQNKDYGDVHDLGETAFTVVDRDGGALPNGETVNTVTLVSENGIDASTDANAVLYADNISVTPTSTNDSTITGSANFNQENYNFSYGTGDLTVNRRAAQIIASAQEKDYGDVHDLGDTAFTVVDRDGRALPNGETVNAVTLVSENGIDASTDANAVLYADNISVTPTSTNDPTITGSANFNQENYTFSYDTGDLTVNRRAAQIIASAQNKDYGDVHDLGDTAFTVVDRDGGALPNSETVNTVTLVSENGVDASTDADVGTYADNISVTPTSTNDPTIAGSANFNQENYNFSYGTGDFTVNRRAITLTANEQEKTYGDQLALDDTVFKTLDKDGDAVLPNGEVVTNVTINSATGVDASTTSDVATYADEIVISGPVAGTDGTGDGFLESNYDITYVAGDLTVNRRAAQIIASAQNKDYGDVHDLGETAFTVVDRDGGALPNGETVNTVTLVSENGIDASTDANAVLYADNISVTPTSTNDSTITGSANFNQENYTFSYGTGDLTINRRAITLTANEQEKIYGDQLALDDTVFTTLDKDGDAVLPNGEVVTNVTINSATGVDASTTLDVATYADEIVISGPVAGTDGSGDGFLESNYDITYVAGDLTVNRRAAQIIASAQEKDYGDVHDLGDTAFKVVDRDGGALPNGETVNTVTLVSEDGIDASTDANAVLYADNISVTPTSTNDPTITGSANFNQENYTFSYDTGDLTVNRRAAQIIASAQEKDYGDVHDLGDMAFTVVDRDGGALPNSETVNTVTLVSENGIDASTDANAVLYADNISVTPTSTNDSTITGSANFNQENYTFGYATGDLTVNRRAAQIIASAQEKDYGDVHDLGDTAFTVVDRDGGALPNGETVNAVTLVSANGVDASTDADVGTYADNISVTPTSTSDPAIAGSANFNQENYTFSYGTGDLTINRRAITLTANEQEKTYGDQLALDDTVFTTLDKDGDAVLPNGEVVTNVTINSATGVDASTTSDVATYADEIVISGPVAGTDGSGDGFLESNYDITYVAGDLTLNRRAAQIIASAQENDYGDVHDLGDTAFTVVDRDGGALPNGETVNTVTLVSENGIDASTDANAVLYADNISVTPTSTNDPTITGSANFNQENYTFSYGTGDLTINRRAITLTANEQEKIYGDQLALDDTVFTTLDKDGDAVLPNGEVVTNVTINSATGVDASTTSDVATYADEIVISGPVAGTDGSGDGFLESNYDITYVAGDLTLNRRAAQIIASAQEKDYGDVYDLGDTAFTVVDRDGGALPNGETVNTVTLVSENEIDASTDANAVLYADNISVTPTSTNDPTITGSANFNQENYTFSYGTGDLTIDHRSIELIIADDNRFAGAVYQIDPAAFATIDLDGDASLPNNESINTLNITSLTDVAEDPSSPMGLYTDELDADAASAIGSNGFSLGNYDVIITPGNFKIDPYPSLPSMAQDVNFEQWLGDNTGLELEDPFSNSYAISQSLGLRLITLDSWATLSGAKKQVVLRSLDSVPLRLQSLDLAEELVEDVKGSKKN